MGVNPPYVSRGPLTVRQVRLREKLDRQILVIQKLLTKT
jgi:hypothetical protein